ncbi:glycosyltransferase [Paracandidimonas soli]|uniref:UDP:flavonoid glycosyltransferase YjiC (YdhE family) n=1 Tax=Paracandidimonas soli TaxID=1917182 RepID=A0A4R3UWD1_9BURK|nr:glycosyltransferase [Paracandidimonas soli]TCU95291.1 UDP:flavonoid glycosyltransferase YjiC (YdhE family) [Paracandidimonas soli]
MKLVALTYGTEGDTRPIAALCRALMDAGHEVSLLANEGTLGSARSLGVPHAALSGNIKEDLGSLVAEGRGVNATVAGLSRIANAQAESWMRQAVQASDGCDGIIVAGLTAFIGLSVAEYRGIPIVGAGMIPISPTRAFASPFIPPGACPSIFNKASHHLVNWMLWLSFRKATNQARKRVLDQGPRHSLWAGHPMLYGVSPALLPEPRDWPENAKLCGQWLGPADSWEPAPELQAFLDAGEPPIYLGFGGMVGFDREALARVLIDVLEGERVVFHPGWSGLPETSLPDNFHVIGNTPHDWLFPRMSLVIHHGGSGTAHSACRAGVPSVVLPFAGDQFFWGRQLERLGVAAAPVSTKQLSSDVARQAVRFARSAAAKSRASKLGHAMSQENGTAAAVAAIASILESCESGLG